MEQNSKKIYRVGQTVFIVASAKANIAPAKVVAKHTTEHEAGVVVRHTCQQENDPQGEATFELESLFKRDPNVAFFESLEDAENHLMNLASQRIKQIIGEARKKVSHPFYSNQARAQQVETQDKSSEDTHAIMTLEDGTRVRVPRELMSEV